jgi:hypothetical protein
MLALFHILTIKSDFICVKLNKKLFFWKNSRYIKPKLDNQNIATYATSWVFDNMVLFNLNKSYQKLCV